MELTKQESATYVETQNAAIELLLARNKDSASLLFFGIFAVFFIATLSIFFININVAGLLFSFFDEAPADASKLASYLAFGLLKFVGGVGAIAGFSYACADVVFALTSKLWISAFSKLTKIATHKSTKEKVISAYAQVTGSTLSSRSNEGRPWLVFGPPDPEEVTVKPLYQPIVLKGELSETISNYGLTWAVAFAGLQLINHQWSTQYELSRALLLILMMSVIAVLIIALTYQAQALKREMEHMSVHLDADSDTVQSYTQNRALADVVNRSLFTTTDELKNKIGYLLFKIGQKFGIFMSLTVAVMSIWLVIEPSRSAYNVADKDVSQITSEVSQAYLRLNESINKFDTARYKLEINSAASEVVYFPTNSDSLRSIGVFRNARCVEAEKAIKLTVTKDSAANAAGGVYFCVNYRLPAHVNEALVASLSKTGLEVPRLDK